MNNPEKCGLDKWGYTVLIMTNMKVMTTRYSINLFPNNNKYVHESWKQDKTIQTHSPMTKCKTKSKCSTNEKRKFRFKQNTVKPWNKKYSEKCVCVKNIGGDGEVADW